MIWKFMHPQATLEMLGHIPSFLNENDPRPAVEQLDQNYRHGGGWSSFLGFTMLPDGNLQYSNDPPVRALAETTLRNEIVRFYDHSWVAIIQQDGTYDISRMD